ncbi:MAG: cell division protein FtsX [Gemmatimonadaceae bacterium]
MSSALREAVVATRRAPLLSALSVTTIAFSLFALGLFGLVAVNIRSALAKVEERVEIRAFASDDTSIEAIVLAAGEINRYAEVASADVVTPEAALAKARRELGEFEDVFEGAVLPASIDIRLRPGHRDPETVRRVARRVREYDFIDDVRFGEEWVTRLHQLRNIAGATGLVLGLAFAAVAVIIIGATIRMTVLSRSREIAIMRLVGATDGFIRRPFLIEGFLKGVFGGLLALFLTWAATRLIEGYLRFDTVFFDTAMAGGGIAFGALIGVVGTALSVRRHLRAV